MTETIARVDGETIVTTITLQVTDSVCHDILTTALEGGYAEEFTVLDYYRDHEADHVITWARLQCEEHDRNAEGEVQHLWEIDGHDVRIGIARLVAWSAEHDPGRQSYLGSQIDEGLRDGWEYLDAIGADAVLQFACFGEVVFG
jgi:hypothetical protein